MTNNNLPPIYVLNLLRSVERKQSMQTQLDSLQLPFEWEEAVDGLNLDKQSLEQYQQTLQAWSQWKSPRTNKTMPRNEISKGEFGCATSHLNIYKKIVARKTPWSVIFEDDIILTKQHFKPILSHLNSLNPDCDIIFLGGLYRSGGVFRAQKNPEAILSFFNRQQLPFSHSLGHFVIRPGGTQAYMISLSGAKKMLQRNTPITGTADVVMVSKYRTPYLHIMAIHPSLAQVCHSFKSTICHSFKSTIREEATTPDKLERNIYRKIYSYLSERNIYRKIYSYLYLPKVFFLKCDHGFFNPKRKHIRLNE